MTVSFFVIQGYLNGVLYVNVLLKSNNLSPQFGNIIAVMRTTRATLKILVVIFAKDDHPRGYYHLRLLRQCQAKCPRRIPLPEKAATQNVANSNIKNLPLINPLMLEAS